PPSGAVSGPGIVRNPSLRHGVLRAEGGALVKVAIRHKRRPTGFPPFIPFALLTEAPPSARGGCKLFLKEKSSFLFGQQPLQACYNRLSQRRSPALSSRYLTTQDQAR